MNNLNPDTIRQIEELIDKRIDERTNLLISAFELFYDVTPILKDFDSSKTKFDLNNAYSLSRLSSLAYREKEYTEMEIKRCFKNDSSFEIIHFNKTESNIYAFGIKFNNTKIICFRGTQTRNVNRQLNNILTDAKTSKMKLEYGKIHTGFYNAYQEIAKDVQAFVEDDESPMTIWICGHSLGGALSLTSLLNLFANSNSSKIKYNLGGVYTFGQPKIGNKKLIEKINNISNGKIFRVVLEKDPVTLIPFFGYRHSKSIIYLRKDGTIIDESNYAEIKSHRRKQILNYFSLETIKLLLSQLSPIKFPMNDFFSDHSLIKYVYYIKDCIKNLETG